MLPELNYAEYVWSSYAIAAAIILWQAIQPVLSYRRIVRQLNELQCVSEEESS